MRSLYNRLCAMIVSIAVLSISLTVLTPIKVEADAGLPIGTYIGPTVLSGLNARHPIEFQSYVQYGQCTFSGEQPWMMLLNVDTGEQYWGGYIPTNSTKVTFKDMDTIRYPGATVRLYMYDKKNLGPGPDGYCHGENHPDFATATPTAVSPDVKLTWKDMDLFDAYYINEVTAKVNTNVPASDGYISTFAIYDYGTDKQKVVFNDWEPYRQCVYSSLESTSCTAQTGRAGESATGFALIPTNLPRYSGTQWPPPGAIKSVVALKSDMGGPPSIPQMTQGGPSASSQDSRVPSADPIDSFSGNFFKEDVDMSVTGRVGMSLDRGYSVGNLGNIGAFGDGWTLGYDIRVQEDSSGNHATVVEENGNLLPFTLSGDGFTGDSPVIRASLSKVNGGWEFKRWKNDNRYLFDSSGYLSCIVDPNGNQVSLTRNTQHQVTKISEGSRWITLGWNASGRIDEATDNLGRSVSYGYDANARLSSVTDPEGNVSSYTYDSSGRMTTYTNTRGGVLTNVYDGASRVISQTSPSGLVTKMSYGSPDAIGRVTNTETTGTTVKTLGYIKGRISSVSDSSDLTKDAWFYYNKNGEMDSSQYADDTVHHMSFEYDQRGNIIASEDTGTKARETFSYNEAGKITRHVSTSGVITDNTYDDRENLVQDTITPSGNGVPRFHFYWVSPQGDVTTAMNPYAGMSSMSYSPDGDVLSLTDPVGDKTNFSYDPVGRLVEKVSSGGTLPDLPQSEVQKFTENYSYDKNDNKTAVTTPLGTTTYQYDPKGNPISVTDPRGKIKSTSYDPDGNVNLITYPDGSTDSFSYDPSSGAKVAWTDSNGRVTRYSQNGMKTTTTKPDGTSSEVRKDILWSSDQVRLYLTEGGNPTVQISNRESLSGWVNTGAGKNYTSYDAQGRVKTETTSNGTDSYSYDGFGNLSSRTSSKAGRNVSYQYDIAGNTTGITYPDGTSISRSIDGAGRVYSVTDWSGMNYSLAYNSDGKLRSVSASNGLKYEQQYAGSLPTEKAWKDAAGAVIASFQNTYSATGQITETANSLSGSSESRPLQWTDNDQVSKIGTSPVTWDGTRVTSTDRLKSLNYSAATGRLTDVTSLSDVSTSFSFDPMGRRSSATTNGVTTNYSWNILGQLTSAGTDTYTYDSSGLRSTVNGTQQVYGQDMKLLSDGTNKFLWGTDGALLAQAPLGATSGSTPLQAVTDGMGSVYAMVQAQPVPEKPDTYQFAVQAQYKYSLFGERTLVAGTDVTSIGFVSEQQDATTGFIYLRARYYDPKTAQFISSDPLVVNTLDEYGYALGNPLQVVDPLGLFGWSDVGHILMGGDNPGDVSSALSLLAIAATASGFAAPIAPFLVLASMTYGGISMAKNIREGNTGGAVIDAVGIVPGAGFFAGKIGSSIARRSVLLRSPVSRAEIKAATRPFDKLSEYSDNIGIAILGVSAGKQC